MNDRLKNIRGYRDLDMEEIGFINDVKALEENVLSFIDEEMHRGVSDGRWLAIARTDLQKGFMSLTRAIAQPTR